MTPLKQAENLFQEILDCSDSDDWSTYDESKNQLKYLLEDHFQIFPWQRLWDMLVQFHNAHLNGNTIGEKPVAFCMQMLATEFSNEISAMYLDSDVAYLYA